MESLTVSTCRQIEQRLHKLSWRGLKYPVYITLNRCDDGIEPAVVTVCQRRRDVPDDALECFVLERPIGVWRELRDFLYYASLYPTHIRLAGEAVSLNALDRKLQRYGLSYTRRTRALEALDAGQRECKIEDRGFMTPVASYPHAV